MLLDEGSFVEMDRFVMDSSAGGIVAVAPSVDLTDRLLGRLRGGVAPATPRP